MTYTTRLKYRKILLIEILAFLTLGAFTFSTQVTENKLKLGSAVLSGDCNTDNKVDILDFQLLSNSFGKSAGQTGFNSSCDFNTDSRVDILDFQLLSNNFGKTISPTPTAPVNTITLIPTPTPLGSGLNVDLGQNNGLIRHNAAGFIGADISATTPSDANLLPLKPYLGSWVRNYSAVQRFQRYQIKLRSGGTYPSSATGDWSKWEGYVATQVQTAKSNGYTNVEFDIENEPDCCGYWPFGSVSESNDDERYYQMWIRAYRKIKSIDPAFKVVGPSIAYNKSWLMNKFLPRVKLENALPDILSWHEIGSTEVYQAVTSMRNFLQSNSYNIPLISINEYGNSDNAKLPGITIKYISEIEKSGIDSAARACWEEEPGGSYECAPHLDNLLTYPGAQPRSVWWVYKSYADMNGNLININPSSGMLGLASKNPQTKKLYILLGNTGSPTPFTVNILNVSSVFNNTAPVNFIVQKIPNSGPSALSAPLTTDQGSLLSVNNTIKLNLSSFGGNDSFFITISQ